MKSKCLPPDNGFFLNVAAVNGGYTVIRKARSRITSCSGTVAAGRAGSTAILMGAGIDKVSTLKLLLPLGAVLRLAEGGDEGFNDW